MPRLTLAPDDIAERWAALKAENGRLRAALEFYADKSRYDNDTEIDRGDGTHDQSCSILDDEGAIARAALAETR